MAIIDGSGKDFKIGDAPALFAAWEFNGTGSLDSLETATTYDANPGLIQLITVDGFVTVTPSDASSNDPRLSLHLRPGNDGSSIGASWNRHIYMGDINDTNAQRVYINLEFPVNLRFYDELVPKCRIDSTETGAFSDVHLFVRLHGTIRDSSL